MLGFTPTLGQVRVATQFDSQLENVQNQPDLLDFKGRATYRWKALNKSYKFALDRTTIQGLLAKLLGSKVAESSLAQLQNSHLRILGEKSHLDVGSVANHRVYYGAFP